MNGSGRPVLGRISVVTPILIKLWNAIQEAAPQHTSRPSKFRALTAAYRHSPTIQDNRSTVIIEPTNPSSSPITEKIKSVWASGIRPAFLTELGSSLLSPLPVSCPEPIARTEFSC